MELEMIVLSEMSFLSYGELEREGKWDLVKQKGAEEGDHGVLLPTGTNESQQSWLGIVTMCQ